jgi:hypothetical protein
MIDWTAIDVNKPDDWRRLADALVQRAIALIQAATDKPLLRDLQADLKDVALKATLACPIPVLALLNSTNRQVTAALLAVDIANLAERSAALDAAGAKVSLAAAGAKTEAARLRLDDVLKGLADLSAAAGELKALRDDLDATPKKDIPAKIDKVLAALMSFEGRIRTAAT